MDLTGEAPSSSSMMARPSPAWAAANSLTQEEAERVAEDDSLGFIKANRRAFDLEAIGGSPLP
jgi:hypothetical protein